MIEPDEVGWRVRMGAGLLYTPMSDKRRAAFDRETEREQAQLERDAEARAEAAAERRGELLMRGVEPHSIQDVLARQAFGEARADAVEARREQDAAELFGHGRPHQSAALLAAAKAARKEREAEAESTPATKADVR